MTEAESFVSDDQSVIEDQLTTSTKNAFADGAEKIFFTSMNLVARPGSDKQEIKTDDKQAEIDSADFYRNLFSSL